MPAAPPYGKIGKTLRVGAVASLSLLVCSMGHLLLGHLMLSRTWLKSYRIPGGICLAQSQHRSFWVQLVSLSIFPPYCCSPKLMACTASFLYAIAILYAISDFSAVQNSNGAFPLAEVYAQATGNKGATFGLLWIILFSLLICVIGTFLTVRTYCRSC